MAEEQVDVVVLGLGVGGEHTATKLARAGLAVVGIDRHLVGGECPYYGCIPSKMMTRASDVLAEARRVGELAGEADVRPSWAPVAARIRDEATDGWDDRAAVERLGKEGVTFVRGHGRLAGPGRVEVDGRSFAARTAVVVNTGTTPGVPPIQGLADTPYWTNRDVVQVESLPGSLAVIGGGAIGLEIAQAVSRFGVQVTVVEVADRILAADEPEASALLTDVLVREGVRVRTGAEIQSVEYDAGTFTLRLDDGPVSADKLLVAAGRKPNLADIGLDTVGLDPGARSLDPDGRLQVADGVYAIGDITGKGAFTHMAMYQADIVVRHVLGEEGPEADYRAVPRVTFTDPEVGSVGLTEQQARETGLDVRVGSADIPESTRGFLHKVGNEGLIKLVADAADDVLVGATSMGPTGGEVLSLLALAVHARVPLPTLRSMIFAYPTFHRAIEAALADLS